MNDDFRMEQSYGEQAYGESLGRYTAKTFGWMFIGLLITFGVAIGMYMTNGLYYVSQVPGWYYILFIAEIGIVIYLSARIDQMTVGTARAMFFLYAAVNGIVFSMYFLIFNVLSLWMAFAITAAFFGVMAILTISYGSSMVAVTGMASMSRNFVPTMGCFFGLAFKKYGMPLQAIVIGEFVINIIFFGFIAMGAPTAIQDVITGLALLIIITLTTKAEKGEIVK